MVAETASAAAPLSLPVGYHFSPSDQELVDYYLKKKVGGESFLSNVISDCDLYGDKAPWEMFPRDAGRGKDRFFVFTRLKRLRKSKRRVSRAASIGEWHGNTAGPPIFDGKKNVIGFKRQFVFKVKKCKEGSGSAPVGHWIMHEYSLDGVDSDSDCVLCEIENKEKKRLRMDDEEVSCEIVNKERKRLRMDEGEGGFLTATEDAGVSSSSSLWSEMVTELTCSDFALSPSVGHSTEQISIQGSEVQAVENGVCSGDFLCGTLSVSTKDAEKEAMSSLQSSITNPVTSSSSSSIPVALASNLDACQSAEVENSGANGFVNLPLNDIWLDDQLAFLTSHGASDFNNLPMFDDNDDLCNLLDFDTGAELGMTCLC